MVDGNDIWEALFGIMEGNVPDEMTEEVCHKLADALNAGQQDTHPHTAPLVAPMPALVPEKVFTGYDSDGQRMYQDMTRLGR